MLTTEKVLPQLTTLYDGGSHYAEFAWLDAGRTWCPTDYAVRNYLLPGHPKFFCRTEALRWAVCRGTQDGAPAERRNRARRLEELHREYPLGTSTLRESLLAGERELVSALLSLSGKTLELLFRRAADGIEDAEDSDWWLLDCGFLENPEWDPDDDDNDEDFLIPGNLPDSLRRELAGKSGHAALAWYAVGLWPLVNPLGRDGRDDEIPMRYPAIANFLRNLSPSAASGGVA